MTARDIILAAAQSSEAGIDWSAVNLRQPFVCVVWANNQFVAVGTTILTSSNGADWKERTIPVADAVLRRVIWSGTQYVAVGTLGTILTSPDGVVWTTRTSGTSAVLNWVVWSGSQFVVVGDSGTILTSPDGITWTVRTSGVSNTLYSVVWSGSQFVVGGSSYTLTSVNGVSWTLRPGPSFWQSGEIILWSGSLYVAAGSADTIWSSPDGINWTQRHTVSSSFFTFTDGFWDGNTFFLIGNGAFDQDSKIFTSLTALSWSEYSTPKMGGFTKGTDIFIGLGAVNPLFYSSADAITWADITTPPKNTILGIATNGTNQIVAVGANRNILTSPDGFNWTLRLSSTSPSLNEVVWSGSQYVAVGGDGLILTGPNGIDWTQRTSGTSSELFDVVWSGSRFVAVGGSGSTAVILTGSDGISWSTATGGVSAVLRSVIWTGSQFVAVGGNGTIITSSNGTSWTQRTSGTLAGLTSIVWSGSRYIATGVTGGYLTSTDGINWSTVSLSGGLFRVFWTGRSFVGAQLYQISRGPTPGTTTSRTKILISMDGINWQPARAPGTIVLYSLVNFRDRLFLVGSSGQVMTSPGVYAQPLPKL